MDIKEKITVYEGFPKEGISFKDINSLIADPEAYRQVVDEFYDLAKNLNVDKIVSPESRGYIFGCPLAYKMDVGLVPIRKPGKLPGEVISISYDLEYGSDSLELQKGSIKPGERVIIVDDLVATGGTLKATADAIEELGGEVVGIFCLIELTDLNGKRILGDYPFASLIQFDH